MRKLILLRALPGAGKTTFATFLLNTLEADVDVTICAADDFFYDDNGEYHYDKRQMYNAHLSCQQNVQIAMDNYWAKRRDYCNGDTVVIPKSVIIVHNTSTTAKEVATYADMAKEKDFQFISLIVENRHGNKSVHNVPEETMERMRNRFEVKL